MNKEQLYETLQPSKEEFEKMYTHENLCVRFYKWLKNKLFGKRNQRKYEEHLETTKIVVKQPDSCIFYNHEKKGCNLQCAMPTYPECLTKIDWLKCEKYKWQNQMNVEYIKDLEIVEEEELKESELSYRKQLQDAGIEIVPSDHFKPCETKSEPELVLYKPELESKEFVKKLEKIYSDVTKN